MSFFSRTRVAPPLPPRAPPLRNRSSVLQRTAAESRAFRSPRQRRGADFQIRSHLVRSHTSEPPTRPLQPDEETSPKIRNSITIAPPLPHVRHAAESEFRAPRRTRAEARAFRSSRQRRGADFQIRSKLVRLHASKIPPARFNSKKGQPRRFEAAIRLLHHSPAFAMLRNRSSALQRTAAESGGVSIPAPAPGRGFPNPQPPGSLLRFENSLPLASTR
jgi:hypothetical protein